MYAGGLFIQQIFEWDLYLSVVLILAITAVYTIIGKFFQHTLHQQKPLTEIRSDSEAEILHQTRLN